MRESQTPIWNLLKYLRWSLLQKKSFWPLPVLIAFSNGSFFQKTPTECANTQPAFTCPKSPMEHQSNKSNLFKVNSKNTRML